jgi:hypothetical protein
MTNHTVLYLHKFEWIYKLVSIVFSLFVYILNIVLNAVQQSLS